MGKIISAQSILKQKGFVQNKFDTSGFMEAVGQYFIDNKVEDRLLLVPHRFLDIDRTVGADGKETFNLFGVTEDEQKLGYKVQTAMNKLIGQPEWVVDMNKNDWERFRWNLEMGIAVPRIIVDKPFFENAAGLLRVMGGYVVEKRIRKKRKTYTVTLI